MSGLYEIYKFMEEWRREENFLVLQNGHLQFSASVNYSSPNFGLERCNCLVTIERTGPSDGGVNIHENGPYTTDTHHLGFSERYQTYRFDRSVGALEITGKSLKMGGKYKVYIIPDGKKVDWLSQIEPSY